jgi:hypothetical protein
MEFAKSVGARSLLAAPRIEPVSIPRRLHSAVATAIQRDSVARARPAPNEMHAGFIASVASRSDPAR